LKLFDGNTDVTTLLGANLPKPAGMYTTDDIDLAPTGKFPGTRSIKPPTKGDLSRFEEDLRVTEADPMDLATVAGDLSNGIKPGETILSRMHARCPALASIPGRTDALE